jgi:hypothetical protein
LNDEHPGAEHTFRSIYIAKTIQKLWHNYSIHRVSSDSTDLCPKPKDA